LEDEPLPPSPPSDAEDLIAQALGRRPELASLQMSRDGRKRTFARWKPTSHCWTRQKRLRAT
jgi:hypothetical protein